MQLRKQLQLGALTISVNWLVLACLIATMAGFIRLGIWQLDRAAEKVAAQETLAAEQQQNAIDIERLQAGQLDARNPDLPNLHVALQGEYLNDKTVLLLAEFFDGMIGFAVVTPFRLTSNAQLVLVNRGWTTGILAPGAEPNLRPVTGPQTIAGQIHVPPANARVFASQVDANTWPLRMRSLEIDVLTDILSEPLFPFEVRLTDSQPGVLVRHWPAVQVDYNINLFYAMQWFLFALGSGLIALFASSNLWFLLRHDRP